MYRHTHDCSEDYLRSINMGDIDRDQLKLAVDQCNGKAPTIDPSTIPNSEGCDLVTASTTCLQMMETNICGAMKCIARNTGRCTDKELAMAGMNHDQVTKALNECNSKSQCELDMAQAYIDCSDELSAVVAGKTDLPSICKMIGCVHPFLRNCDDKQLKQYQFNRKQLEEVKAICRV